MTTGDEAGRANQKKRTRTAIVEAGRELIRSLAPAQALSPAAGSADPVERIAFACEFLLRGVLAYQGAVRAMIAATITRPELAEARPGLRFGLIDQALDPVTGGLPGADPAGLGQLKDDLAAVVSAEALFVLTDLARLTPGDAIASLVRTATT